MLTTALIFDPKTLANWKAEGVSDVAVTFAQKGCEGTELAVTLGKPGMSQNPETPFESRAIPETNILIHALPEDWEKLQNARITHVKGKWIFTSDAVKRRCGCGSSFSFSDEDRLVRDFPEIKNPNFSLMSRSSRELVEIHGEHHTIVDLGGQWESEIRIPAGKTVAYRGLFSTGNRLKVRFFLEEGAKLDTRFLVLASGGHAQSDIEAIMLGSRTDVQMEYRVFAFEDAEIGVDTHIDIRQDLEEVVGRISGKNIFFADHAKITGIPRVSAASDKISAGHSLSFEKLSEIDEFFLQSRGIPARKARRMLAEAHIHRIFSDFPEWFEEVEQYLAKAAASGLE